MRVSVGDLDAQAEMSNLLTSPCRIGENKLLGRRDGRCADANRTKW